MFGMGTGVTLAQESLKQSLAGRRPAMLGDGGVKTLKKSTKRDISKPHGSGLHTQRELNRRKKGEASRAISIARLNVSPRLHLRPIDVVVYDGPSGGCPRET